MAGRAQHELLFDLFLMVSAWLEKVVWRADPRATAFYPGIGLAGKPANDDRELGIAQIFKVNFHRVVP